MERQEAGIERDRSTTSRITLHRNGLKLQCIQPVQPSLFRLPFAAHPPCRRLRLWWWSGAARHLGAVRVCTNPYREGSVRTMTSWLITGLLRGLNLQPTLTHSASRE